MNELSLLAREKFSSLKAEDYSPLFRRYLLFPDWEEFKKCIVIYRECLYLTDIGREYVDSWTHRPFSGEMYPVQVKWLRTLDYVQVSVIVELDWHKVPQEHRSAYFQEIDGKMFNMLPTRSTPEYEGASLDAYYEFIKEQFSKKEIALAYMAYLRRHSSIKEEIPNYMYVDCSAFIQAESQIEQYVALTPEGGKYYLASDGLGVASCMCILRDIDYVSNEPNPVGLYARKLGIITHLTLDETMEDRTYIFLFCQKYYKLPMFKEQKYVVWDIDSHIYPGLKMLSNMSVSMYAYDEYSPISTLWKKEHSLKMVIPNSGFPLDAQMHQIMINYNIPVLPIVQAQYLLASSEFGINSAFRLGVYTEDYWIKKMKRQGEELKYKAAVSLVNKMKDKTMLFYHHTFPFRSKRAGKMFDKTVLTMVDRTLPMQTGEDYVVVPEPHQELMFEDYRRDGSYYMVFTKRHSVIRYLKLREEDLYIYNRIPIIKVIMVSYHKVPGGYMGVYIPVSETSESLVQTKFIVL